MAACDRPPEHHQPLDRFLRSPLWHAASQNRVAALDELVDELVDENLDAGDWSGETPLIAAASAGSVDAVGWLLRHGAKTSLKDAFGNTALIAAKDRGADAVVAVLEDWKRNQVAKVRRAISLWNGVRPCFERWLLLLAKKQHTLEAVVRRMRLRETSACLARWREYTAQTVRLRLVAEVLAVRTQQHVMLHAWQRWNAFLHAKEKHQEDWGDKHFVLAAVARDGLLLRFATAALRSNKEIVMAAVAQHGAALQFSRLRQNADKKVVLCAVKRTGVALEFAAPALQNDKEVALAAVSQDGFALRFVSDALQTDPELKQMARTAVFAAVSKDPDALEHAPAQLQTDREYVLQAVSCNGLSLRHAWGRLNGDQRVVLAAVARTVERCSSLPKRCKQTGTLS